jgi:hypothetical protein
MAALSGRNIAQLRREAAQRIEPAARTDTV